MRAGKARYSTSLTKLPFDSKDDVEARFGLVLMAEAKISTTGGYYGETNTEAKGEDLEDTGEYLLVRSAC
jgi:hypothetical protein